MVGTSLGEQIDEELRHRMFHAYGMSQAYFMALGQALAEGPIYANPQKLAVACVTLKNAVNVLYEDSEHYVRWLEALGKPMPDQKG